MSATLLNFRFFEALVVGAAVAAAVTATAAGEEEEVTALAAAEEVALVAATLAAAEEVAAALAAAAEEEIEPLAFGAVVLDGVAAALNERVSTRGMTTAGKPLFKFAVFFFFFIGFLFRFRVGGTFLAKIEA